MQRLEHNVRYAPLKSAFTIYRRMLINIGVGAQGSWGGMSVFFTHSPWQSAAEPVSFRPLLRHNKSDRSSRFMHTAQAREMMVEQQVRTWSVLDERVLEILRDLPRERFVPAA